MLGPQNTVQRLQMVREPLQSAALGFRFRGVQLGPRSDRKPAIAADLPGEVVCTVFGIDVCRRVRSAGGAAHRRRSSAHCRWSATDSRRMRASCWSERRRRHRPMSDSLLAYAAFLDRYRRSGAISGLPAGLQSAGIDSQAEKKRDIARRLTIIALLRDDVDSARKYVAAYREAGGSGFERADEVLNPPKLNEQTADEWVEHTRPAVLVPAHGGALQRSGRRRAVSGPGAQRGDQRLSRHARRRDARADRVHEAGAAIPVAGARTGGSLPAPIR